jgi:hypothetical protein
MGVMQSNSIAPFPFRGTITPPQRDELIRNEIGMDERWNGLTLLPHPHYIYT